MAQMVPDRLPMAASAGEKRLFEVLSKLPEDTIVYYEPVIGRRYPDFVVILPSVGVLVIEAKGWYPTNIIAADDNQVTVRVRAEENRATHPVRQAREYMYALMDEVRRNGGNQLMRAEGDHQGKFVFPFSHLALLNNCSRAQLDERGLSTIFAHPRVVTRDEFDHWAKMGSAELVTALKDLFDPWWHFHPLSEIQINSLRGAIHPEIKLPQMPTMEGSQEVRVLDLRQERNARSIGEGHRVIYGVAGSGKTVILLSRAKMLAEEHQLSVLVLCYNKALAAYFQSVLNVETVRCLHFHGWAAGQGVRFRSFEDEEAFGDRLVSQLAEGYGDAARYDAVLIDEAQDFSCSWFKAAKLALKQPDDGDLIVVGDGNQSVYRRRPFSWSDAGIHAVGRTINLKLDLDKNYRNTREIMRLAQKFARADVDSDESMPSMASNESNCLRSGALPLIIGTETLIEEVVQRIEGLLQKFKPAEIAVIYRANDGAWLLRLATLIGERVSVNWPQANNWNVVQADEGIYLTTAHSAKGLQWKAVIIVKPEQMPFIHPTDEARMRDASPEAAKEIRRELELKERSLMYVALTRAEEELLIIYENEAGFVPRLKESAL